MKRTKLQGMTVDQLIQRFTAIALDQDKAIVMDNGAKPFE
jgi:hypothetical protein